MANVDVYTEQEGICISKEYKEAREERKDMNGRVWPATEEKFIVKVVSCSRKSFNKDTGMNKSVVIDYETDKETYDKIKFESDKFMKARVGFSVKAYGQDVRYVPEYFELLKI